MTARHRNAIYREAERMLRASGKPYRFEFGKKHCKIFVADKLVGVFTSKTSVHVDIRSNPVFVSLRKIL